jgi:hypothetical protein
MSVYAFTFGHYVAHLLNWGSWFPRVLAFSIIAILALVNLRGCYSLFDSHFTFVLHAVPKQSNTINYYIVSNTFDFCWETIYLEENEGSKELK